MIRTRLAGLGALLGCTMGCAGQVPLLAMTPAVSVSPSGSQLTFLVANGPSSAPYTVFADLVGGPVDVFGERIYLGLGASLVPVQFGSLSASGMAVGTSQVAAMAGLVGTALYAQAVVLDPSAQNGMFRVSNGASGCFYNAPSRILQTFAPQTLAGFTGNFSSDIAGHLRGGPITMRIARTVLPGSTPFALPIMSPLQPNGCRQQVVFRASDLGATGLPEKIVAVRWRAQAPVVADAFPSFTFRMSHTSITPNYSLDPFTGLPVAPNSGLRPAFADNEQLSGPATVVYSGAYAIDPATVMPGNYVAYPMLNSFSYDGTSSLLLDFRVTPSSALGLNGMAVNLMVASSPLPGTRCVAAGTPQQPVDPNSVVSGIPDNAMPDFEMVFARTTTYAMSPWLGTSFSSPDYGSPIVASSLPAGTSITIEYRGGDLGGGNPTPWSSTPDIADGRPGLQYRIWFESNLLTDERPLIDTLLIPVY